MSDLSFLFYPSAYLNDRHVRAMTYEARSMLITLAAIYWLDGELPLEHLQIAHYLRMTLDDFERVWWRSRRC